MKEILKIWFHEESDYSKESTYDTEVFRSTFFQPIQFEPEQKISVVMKAMRKKLNILTLQLPIYYILEEEISSGANADITKTKWEK